MINIFQIFKTIIRTRILFFSTFLITALLYCIITFSTDFLWSTRLLLSWNLAIVMYLALTMHALWRADTHSILNTCPTTG